MKRLLIFIIITLQCCSYLFARKIRYDNATIEHNLSKMFNSEITLENISIYNSPVIIKEFPYVYWDSVNNRKSYHTITVPHPGIVMTFVVHKDSQGCKYRSTTYLPFSLFDRTTNLYYYQDRWIENGTHFDEQGKALPTDDCIEAIINHIQFD